MKLSVLATSHRGSKGANMHRDYGKLINPASEIAALGSTDPADRVRRDALEADYAEALQQFATDILKEMRTSERAIEAVNYDLNEISSLSDEALYPVLDRIRYDAINRIEELAGPSLSQRPGFTRLVGLGGVAFVVLVVAGYFALRSYNAVALGAPIETRAGIEQRANALAKVLRYEDMGGGGMNVRPSGFVKNLVLWPFEPTDQEIAAARDLAGLIFAGAVRLGEERQACKLPLTNSEIVSEGEIDLLRKTVAHIRDKRTTWRTPPVMTVLDPIRATYPC